MDRPIDHTEVLRWLEARSDELRAEIAAAQRLPDRSHEVGDFKDEATDSLASTVSGAEVERDLAELRDNEHTLAIIRQGRYGLCEDCAEPIEAARLQARPASTRCLACQEAAERRPQAAGS